MPNPQRARFPSLAEGWNPGSCGGQFLCPEIPKMVVICLIPPSALHSLTPITLFRLSSHPSKRARAESHGSSNEYSKHELPPVTGLGSPEQSRMTWTRSSLNARYLAFSSVSSRPAASWLDGTDAASCYCLGGAKVVLREY